MAAPDKRSRLIEAADVLVHRQGFNQTTLADIAKEAKVPLGNVYYYFKTKDELGDALIEERSRAYQTLREEWDLKPDPKARLNAFIQMTLDNRQVLARSGCPIGSLCEELHKDRGALANRASMLFEAFLGWLEEQFRALGQGRESATDAIHLLSALQGATLLAHSFGTTSYIEREAARLKKWIRDL